MCEPVSAVFDVLNTFYCEAGVLGGRETAEGGDAFILVHSFKV